MSSKPPLDSSACIFHAVLERMKSDVSPLEAMHLATVVGVQMSASGVLPPLCEECGRRLRGALGVNGIVLLDADAETVASRFRATGTHFHRIDFPKTGREPS
jgi:hypothetical protein